MPSIVIYPEYTPPIVIANILLLGVCGWYRRYAAGSDDELLLRIEALYKGFVNGAALGLVVGIVTSIALGRYIPWSFTIACGMAVGILLAVLYPKALSKAPSF